MKHLLAAFFPVLFASFSFAQNHPVKPNKYPSLLWEIRGKDLSRPSYLFGTMHVSSKMAFNLSDSFYLALRQAQVVALETDPGTWQEDFSRYDLTGETARYGARLSGGGGYAAPQDYLTINTLKLTSYEKWMEMALYSNPSMINNFLYRSNADGSSDFEEDTYLDLHIFQAGKKLGKKICGVEDFDGSMQLVKEAYRDAAREKKKDRGLDVEDHLSFRNMEEAYRTGNLDLLDTINKVNSRSAAFDEKFLYKRNEIQAASIDSILRKGTTLFVGVGAAHLPGERGVIELLRRKGYLLRPIRMRNRDSEHKEAIEKMRVPVQFSKQSAADGFFSVAVPGKLYRFGASWSGADMLQYADMMNGSYYTVTRLFTNAALIGHDAAQVERKLDSVLYENIPGKILSKKAIVKNGYRGFDISNRTRRGDYQRYQIFITPLEILIFKMSGNGNYVTGGTEAAQFFNSIVLKEAKTEWTTYRAPGGGFEVALPHQPLVVKRNNQVYGAYDAVTKTAYAVVRTNVHNHDWLEEDSFDLRLLEESFASSEYIQRCLRLQPASVGAYPALDAAYKFKDSSVAIVRYVVNGPRFYTLIAKGDAATEGMQAFLRSFRLKPFEYGPAQWQADTALRFRVQSPVALKKEQKLAMFPEEGFYGQEGSEEDTLVDNGQYKDLLVVSDTTHEKIHVYRYKPSAYYQALEAEDSIKSNEGWVIRHQQRDTLADKTLVTRVDFGHPKSSRMLMVKTIDLGGAVYSLQTLGDTLAAPTAFVQAFFNSFGPTDSTAHRFDPRAKKSALFFQQFFSRDTLEHRRAVKNIRQVQLDSTDFPLLKKAIESWQPKEKRYLETKTALITKLADMPARQTAAYLKALYQAAGDTVDLQSAALETLLRLRTADAYQTFAGIMENDPPVLLGGSAGSGYAVERRYGEDYSTGTLFDNLRDSLQLTAGIYKSLLPLINLDDYSDLLMELTAELVDSNRIDAKLYEAYLPKFLLQAKQALKKQVISEKTKAIEQASREEETEQRTGFANDEDNGNQKLSLYATLLQPFYDKHAGVPALLTQLLQTTDKRLKYNTAILLLRNRRPVPDSMWRYFAALDDYRYQLYIDLEKAGRLSLFPAKAVSREAFAKSRLLYRRSYNRPDTLVLLQKVPFAYKEQNGVVYVFKYKENKGDNTWKLAAAGLLPPDETQFGFAGLTPDDDEWLHYNFTELTHTKLTSETTEDEQVQKLLKKLRYSRRKSTARYYQEQPDYENFTDPAQFRD